MKNMKSCLIFSILLMIIFCPAAGALDTYLHLKIVELKNAHPPEFLGDKILFSCKPDRPVRSVSVIFSHENFSVRHVFEINENNVFFLIYPIPKKVGLLKYRLNIDGLLMKDPENPSYEEDALGIEYSLLKIEKVIEDEIINPAKNDSDTVRFVFRSKPGRTISIVGTFNDWDPYMHILTEETPGNYAITFHVPAGIYFYYFIVDGAKMLDPLNPNPIYTRNMEDVCFFSFP